jgi:hypothetical protein
MLNHGQGTTRIHRLLPRIYILMPLLSPFVQRLRESAANRVFLYQFLENIGASIARSLSSSFRALFSHVYVMYEVMKMKIS